MNRRAFLAAAAMGGFAVTIAKRLPVLAQEATATPNVVRFAADGLLVTASRNFEATALRSTGGLRYGTAVDIFAGVEQAERGFEECDDFRVDYVAALERQSGAVAGDVTELTAPSLGDLRRAETLTATVEGTALVFVFLFAQQGEVLHRWMGVGVTNPAEELFAIANDHMTFDVVDPEKDEQVFALIPNLDDLPAGFVFSEGMGERIERFGPSSASPPAGTPESAS